MTQVRPNRLDDRYGRAGARRRGRLTALIGGGIAVAAVAAWAIWTGIGGVTTSLEADTAAYAIHGDRSVTVHWVVNGRATATLVCAIEAQDSSGVVLGLQEVVVRPDGSAVRTGTTVVRTTRLAVTGLIDSCRDA